MDMTKGLTSTGNVVAETPEYLFKRLSAIFNFTLDVCALPENAKCESFYTPDDDGLSNPWRGGGMVQSSLWERDIRMGQERLRGIQERLQRLCSHAASCQDRHKVVVGLGEGQGHTLLDKRKDQIW